ncbi:MAG TPA: DUF2270 domain-containing protein [Anaerolineae bacterium]|nr:DUF2270 domain-containing protein [Anaerolineae bacterium]
MNDIPRSTTEPVWSYRGYQIKASEFTTAMAHFYRGEMARSNVWRQRLDNTTNWAVITAGAALSFAFSSPQNPHGVIPLNTLLITLFLYIEARRYRYYELFTSRIRLMETDFFASMLVPPFGPAADWAESLAENLLHPHFTISIWEAFGRRFRRNYMAIYVILALAWLFKNILHPSLATSFQEVIEHAAIGPIPGWLVLIIGLGFNGILFLIGLVTVGLHRASGEILPRFGEFPRVGPFLERLFQHEEPTEVRQPRKRVGAWYRPRSRRPQLLTLIITGQGEAVSQALLQELKRGVTRLPGLGMFTGQARDVLLVAVTLTEIARLKAVIRQSDESAFVIVSPAQEVLGKGFQPLE